MENSFSNKRIAALVVTYNRIELLKECIDALKKQSYSDFDILVVNNASTDGTAEWLESNQDEHLSFITAASNIGGAGGFSMGMKELVKRGYDYIWLMDDDTIPEQEALKVLVHAGEKLSNNFGFLVSCAKWTDGNLCVMNRPLFLKDDEQTVYLPVKKATFVSMFVPTTIVKELGLPVKEFFIWGDDQEYTDRISDKYPSYYVPGSVVIHKSKNNHGSDVVRDDVARIPFYFYAYRNELYISRHKSFLSLGYYWFRFIKTSFKILLFAKPGTKRARLRVINKGMRAGLSFNPQREYVK